MGKWLGGWLYCQSDFSRSVNSTFKWSLKFEFRLTSVNISTIKNEIKWKLQHYIYIGLHVYLVCCWCWWWWHKKRCWCCRCGTCYKKNRSTLRHSRKASCTWSCWRNLTCCRILRLLSLAMLAQISIRMVSGCLFKLCICYSDYNMH